MAASTPLDRGTTFTSSLVKETIQLIIIMTTREYGLSKDSLDI